MRNKIKHIIMKHAADERVTWVTLVDLQKRIIFTNRPDFLHEIYYSIDSNVVCRLVQENKHKILPQMSQYITLWRRVQKSWYKYEKNRISVLLARRHNNRKMAGSRYKNIQKPVVVYVSEGSHGRRLRTGGEFSTAEGSIAVIPVEPHRRLNGIGKKTS